MDTALACSTFWGLPGRDHTRLAQFVQHFLNTIAMLAVTRFGDTDDDELDPGYVLEGVMRADGSLSAAEVGKMAAGMHTAMTLTEVKASRVRCPPSGEIVFGPLDETPRAYAVAEKAYIALATLADLISVQTEGEPRSGSVQQLLLDSEPSGDPDTAQEAAEAMVALRQCNDASLELQGATVAVMMVLQLPSTDMDQMWPQWWTAVYERRVRPRGAGWPTTVDVMKRLAEAAEIMFWPPTAFVVKRGEGDEADVHVSWSPMLPVVYLQEAQDMTEFMQNTLRTMQNTLADTILQELRVPNVTRSVGEKQCAICQDNLMNDAVIAGEIVACRHNDVAHYYHEGCLRGWIVQNKTPMLTECPVCRGPLVSDFCPQDYEVGFSSE